MQPHAFPPRFAPNAQEQRTMTIESVARIARLTLAACVCGAWTLGAHAQATQLTPPEQRISDEAIHADHGGYRALQARIEAVNAGGRPLRDYHLAKAQCWLDVSFHEYSRNDRSAFVQEALTEAEKLVVVLEQAKTDAPLPGPWETPLVNGAARLRPDLWDAAAKLRGQPGFACAQARAACAEVELVHAGNEYNQQQWRHAKPYIQIAEDYLGEAQQAAQQCAAPAPVVPAPTPEAAPVPVAVPVPVAAAVPSPTAPVPVGEPAPVSAPLRLNVMFNFDRHQLDQIRPASRRELDAFIVQLQRSPETVGAIRIVGHADRLNRTSASDYNLRLSQRRAQTVHDYLVARGVDARRMQVGARGDAEPVEACRQVPAARTGRKADPALTDCLLPNRRVEVVVEPAPR